MACSPDVQKPTHYGKNTPTGVFEREMCQADISVVA
ncbi:hypothetical protein TNIN_474841, partial [Trichonephila inaurata madagascariensis]